MINGSLDGAEGIIYDVSIKQNYFAKLSIVKHTSELEPSLCLLVP